MAHTSRTGNRILDALPQANLDRLSPCLERVVYTEHTVLQPTDEEIGHVYFPISGVASLVVTSSRGETVDTALIGSEGMVGLPVFLGTGRMPVEAVVQARMEALQLSAEDLRTELDHDGELINLLQRYAQMVMVELAQLILCNRVHDLEQRCARLLLQIEERLVSASTFQATQQFISEMVGANRPPVTEVLADFRAKGLIAYQRGSLTVLDRDALHARACECYTVIRVELDRLLASGVQYEISSSRHRPAMSRSESS